MCCRVPGDIDEVNTIKVACDQWHTPSVTLPEPHTAASLLKLWFRELAEPVIPHSMYLTAVTHCDDVTACLDLVSRLPQLNRLVLTYLIHFLQVANKFNDNVCSRISSDNFWLAASHTQKAEYQ